MASQPQALPINGRFVWLLLATTLVWVALVAGLVRFGPGSTDSATPTSPERFGLGSADSPTPTSPVPTERTTAFMVAALDSNSTTPSEAEVSAVQAALDALQGACIGSESGNADAAQVAHRLLAEQGVAETRLAILTSTRQAIPVSVEGLLTCDEVMASLVVLRTPDR